MNVRTASSLSEPLNPIAGGCSARLRVRRFVYPLLGLLLLFGSTEIGLRVILGLGHPILYEIDPAFGYFTQPLQHTRRLFARTATNGLGMRSPEFALDKPKGTLRLMFLGDSTTYGTTEVDQDDIFVERVRKSLSTALHRPVQDFNAAANAWAISNEGGFLFSRGTYRSDYVLLVLNSGDLDQPFSRFSDISAGYTAYPRSAIGELLTRLVVLGKQHSHNDAGTTVEYNPGIEQANLRELSSMAQFLKAQGSGFLLVFVPFRREIAQGARSSVPHALTSWAGSEGIDLIDLTASVSSYQTEAITLRDRTHYNSLGNRLLADSLEGYLAAKFHQHP